MNCKIIPIGKKELFSCNKQEYKLKKFYELVNYLRTQGFKGKIEGNLNADFNVDGLNLSCEELKRDLFDNLECKITRTNDKTASIGCVLKKEDATVIVSLKPDENLYLTNLHYIIDADQKEFLSLKENIEDTLFYRWELKQV